MSNSGENFLGAVSDGPWKDCVVSERTVLQCRRTQETVPSGTRSVVEYQGLRDGQVVYLGSRMGTADRGLEVVDDITTIVDAVSGFFDEVSSVKEAVSVRDILRGDDTVTGVLGDGAADYVTTVMDVFVDLGAVLDLPDDPTAFEEFTRLLYRWRMEMDSVAYEDAVESQQRMFKVAESFGVVCVVSEFSSPDVPDIRNEGKPERRFAWEFFVHDSGSVVVGNSIDAHVMSWGVYGPDEYTRILEHGTGSAVMGRIEAAVRRFGYGRAWDEALFDHRIST